MAASKKYGYQLRGDKLSIVELDVTGSGGGLNYEYNEGSGLDISTDPSSWKSPSETIANGLQIEYLSNGTGLSFGLADDLETQDLIPALNSSMIDISYLGVTGSADYSALGITSINPCVISELIANGPDGGVSNLLKVVKAVDPIAPDGAIFTNEGFATANYEFIEGAKYTVSFDMALNAYQDGWTYPFAYVPEVRIRRQDYEVDFIPLSYIDIYNGFVVNSIVRLNHPGNSDQHSLNTGWAHFSFSFISNFTGGGSIYFALPNMGEPNNSPYLLLDNLRLTQEINPIEALSFDSGDQDITLPSYAQKALLDYVRAQEAYEGGDLEKWNFFMKQFRSKLERWEDSRITGPRVLGPHGPSSIT